MAETKTASSRPFKKNLYRDITQRYDSMCDDDTDLTDRTVFRGDAAVDHALRRSFLSKLP